MAPLFFTVAVNIGVACALRQSLPPSSVDVPSDNKTAKARSHHSSDGAAGDAALQEVLEGLALKHGECDLCATKWLFVMSTGRSGSTTVLEMMGSVPGFYLAGENGGMMNKQFDMFKHMRLAGNSGCSAWAHGPISQHGMFCAIQYYITEAIGAAAFQATHTIGFKEIRWGVDATVANFMLQVFPCARFIISTRLDLIKQLASESQAEWSYDTNLKKATSMLEKWQSNHRDKATLIHLEQFSVNWFNMLLRWLNVTDCSFKSLVHTNDDGRTTIRHEHNNLTEGTCHMA
uniref:Protein-tyrosine sulfotransferase n=1 Tax=Alexandrium catenella TaxID=2925 RepID=A0A7S1RBC7_ALECA